MSIKGVLRRLHFQYTQLQEKFVRVIKEEVFDVGVDFRKDSELIENGLVKYYPKRIKTIIYSKRICSWIPCLSDEAEFVYKCTDFCNSNDEVEFNGMTQK